MPAGTRLRRPASRLLVRSTFMTQHAITAMALASSGGHHHHGALIGLVILIIIIAVAAFFLVRRARSRRDRAQGNGGNGS
jgi:large-conductance mechanosensitive channel